MQPDYSLEQIMQEINDSKSAEYFGEVFSSYQNENYRSAIVMLWSVAVCDALFKLRHLVDVYGDKPAQNILNDVAKMQKKIHGHRSGKLNFSSGLQTKRN